MRILRRRLAFALLALLIHTPAIAATGSGAGLKVALLGVGAALGGLATAIYRRRGLKQSSASEQRRAWTALAGLREGVIATDSRGRVVFMNPAAEICTGWRATDAEGLAFDAVYRVIDEHSRAPIDYLRQPELAERPEGDEGRRAVRLIRRDGEERPVHDSFTRVLDDRGELSGYAVLFNDVSELRALAQQLSWQANHDALTGLVNRREFERRVSQSICSAREQALLHVLLYIDLDNFKIVNDSCGHSAGDELLRSLASLMSSRIRGSDTLARVGGDEFGALLQSCPLDQGLRIANAIREVVRDFRFVWEGKSFTVGASIGLVPIDGSSDDVHQVLAAADSSCYVAKDKGRDRVHVHRARQVQRRTSNEPQMIARLTHAFEHGAFLLYHQRIAALGDAPSYPHYEILVRMRAEDGELLTPMAFIPTAERYNLLTAVDRWVISELIGMLHRRLQAGDERVTPGAGLYSVNLSGASINDSSFTEYLRKQLAVHPIPPGLLCFEVTETTAISNLTKAAELMHELKGMGCRFALDDFGIGMSSFAYLKYLPVDYLKIDGTFIRDMATDEMDCAIVEAINRIAHILSIQTVGECVEDQATLDRLTRLGVDYAQGYMIARPEPIQSHTTLGGQ